MRHAEATTFEFTDAAATPFRAGVADADVLLREPLMSLARDATPFRLSTF
jgi:hypothetical protein